MADLADADPVTEALTFLRADPAVLALFPAGAGDQHITGMIEGPWPHLSVSAGDGGDLRGLVGASMVGSVRIEVVGPYDGTVSSVTLRATTMRILLALMRLPERVQPAGRPVVSKVEPSDTLFKQTTASGQIRYVATMSLTMSPPQV